MPTRTVEVPVERLPRWVANFARRHDGAALTEAALTEAGLTGAGLTQATSSRSSRTRATTADDDAAAPGQVAVLRLQGGDGEVAELHRWPLAPDTPRTPGTPEDRSGAAFTARPADTPGSPKGRSGPARTPEPPEPPTEDPDPTGAVPTGAVPTGAVPTDATTAEALEAITSWCAPPEHLGLVLIRRGGYAVGRAEGGHLRSHKSGTRYVQSRTAAGGWSQQRFARRRGNQADALVGTVADLAVRHLLPAPQGSAPRAIEALVLGGDRALVAQVLADPRLAPLAEVPRRMFADLPEPRFAVLEQALQRGRSIPVRITPAH